MNTMTEKFLAIQTQDVSQIQSLENTIKKRNRQSLPVDKLIEKLNILQQVSIQLTDKFRKLIPEIRIEPELPIAQKSTHIIELLKTNQVIIVAGETGCGKTTQLPKICLQAGLGLRGKIAHTQPRRVAATSVASRIADELGTPLGGLVGYNVRFAEKNSDSTRVKLMTDGILLAELQSDPFLSQYEVVIIDEAHERSLNIDFLLGFLKQLIKKRKDLKVIITSATIDPQSFSEYFSGAPVVLVEGRTYPVETVYQPIEADEKEGNQFDDPVMSGVANAVDSCFAHSSGDILIFSHGENEIKNISKFLNKRQLRNTEIHPLFARLGIKEQQAIFKSSQNRKIIIATNVAETSLTIPNIVFVIDIGTARVSRYSQRTKIQQLPVEKISQASANQRQGRCGRICPGVCIRLYSEDDFNNRTEYTEPEISRTNLSSVVLRLKSLKVRDVESFPFIRKPDEKQWRVAFNLLYELAAVDLNRELTNVGRQMSRLALDPQLARILLDPDLVAVEEMLILTSFLSVRDVRVRPLEKQQKADECHRQYQDKHSDVISIINLWRHLEKERSLLSSSKFKQWCQHNFINFIGWLEWRNIYRQIKENIAEFKVTVQGNQVEIDEIHRSLICGFVSHLMHKTQENHYQGARGINVWIHPSSLSFKRKIDWVLSTEIIETDKIYARTNVPIKPEWIEKCVPHIVKNHYADTHWRKKTGYAVCTLNQTVLGLPVTHNRLVDASNVEMVKARELFLLEGLAKDNVNQSFPFLSKNRDQLSNIGVAEEKLRTNDIRISEHQLASLYSALIPNNLCTVSGLRRWLKADWQDRNQRLTFKREELLQQEIASVEEFPPQLSVNGVHLPLSYCFAPGEVEDGVTVDIPEQMLKQFKQSDFDWLVPGYLSQKIQAVLKSLPKTKRKLLIPIADTTELCMQALEKIDTSNKNFKLTIIELVSKLRNVKLHPDEVDTVNIPSHLKMKFRRAGKNKKNNLVRSQIDVLTNEHTSSDRSARDNTNRNSLEKLYSWPNNFQGIESVEQVDGTELRIFSGLIDNLSHVSLGVFSDIDSAMRSHLQGVARLLIIDQLKLVKELKNGWPDRLELDRYGIRFGGFTTLFDWLSLAEANSICRDFNIEKMNNKSFRQLVDSFAKSARAGIAARLTEVLILLKKTNAIYLQLAVLKSDVYSESVSDIKVQLSELWSIKRIIQQQGELATNYNRYLEGIESRITRIQENFPKEKQCLGLWLEWLDWWKDLESESHSVKFEQEMDSIFWVLQEYRVSLFATKVRVNGKVSSKKLQKMFESVELALSS
ncbi:MAG: ATP-dependent RNA helicase HrpA [Kangiellaceae bacterium]|nr:ATP-dependent RNA helicase HrpA [Kangiellaceae bacterium]